MDTQNNRALADLAKVWALAGDWMQCRRCKKVLVASRDGEPMKHADGCKHSGHEHPWQELRKAMSN